MNMKNINILFAANSETRHSNKNLNVLFTYVIL